MKKTFIFLVLVLIFTASSFAQEKHILQGETNATILKTLLDLRTIDNISQKQSEDYNWGEIQKHYHQLFRSVADEFPPAASSSFLSLHGDFVTTIMLDTLIIAAAYFLDHLIPVNEYHNYQSATGVNRKWILGSNSGWYFAPSLSSGVAAIRENSLSFHTSIEVGEFEKKIIEDTKREHLLNAREYVARMAFLLELTPQQADQLEQEVFKTLMKNAYRAMGGAEEDDYEEVNIFNLLQKLSISNSHIESLIEFEQTYDKYVENMQINDRKTKNDLLVKQMQDSVLINTLSRIDTTLKMIEVREQMVSDPEMLQKLKYLKNELNQTKENYKLQMLEKR